MARCSSPAVWMLTRRILASVAAVGLAACGTGERHADPLTPHASVDDRHTLGDGGVSAFYRYDGVSPQTPGLLLRQEALSPHQALPGASRSLRLLYTSTNGLDGKTGLTVSGTLHLPSGAPPESGWPLLVWSHGTVGIADICAPSWTGYVPFHVTHLTEWLAQGYAIAASDYQGLGTPGTHPYLATRPAAYSNLDLIRAVQAAAFPVSQAVILAGQSQGAGAAIATAAYARTYAPDLDLRGVVATGVPFFTPQALIAVQEARPRDRVDPMLGYNFLALSLLALIDPEFRLEDYVSAEALPLARGVASICNRDMRARIEEAGLTYEASFRQSPSGPLETAFEQMQFPTLSLNVPVFVGMGSGDRDTPLRMQAELVRQACAAGTRVERHIYDGYDHLSTLNRSQAESSPFIARAFSGAAIPGNCPPPPGRSAPESH